MKLLLNFSPKRMDSDFTFASKTIKIDNKNMAQTIEEIIEFSPSNRFSMEITFIVALTWFLPGTQVVLITNIVPYVQCEYNLADSTMALSTSLFFIGMFIGNLLFGYIGDTCGRKFAILCGSFLLLYFGLLGCATTSIVFLSATRFFVGVGCSDVFVNGSALVTEYVKINQRTTVILIFVLVSTAGSSLGYLLSYLILNSHGWRILTVVVCLPAIPFVIALYRVPESFKYLQLTNNRDKLIEIVQHFCNMNKMEIPHAINMECKSSRQRASYVFILKHHGAKTVLLFWMWLGGVLCYYAQSFLFTYRLRNHSCAPEPGTTSASPLNPTTAYPVNITTITTQYPHHCQIIQDSDHLVSFGISLTPLVSILVMAPLANLGRKPLILLVFLIQCSVYALQMVCLPYWLNLVLLTMLNSTGALFTSIMYLYTAELYPTVVRTTAVGLVASVSKLCLVVVPLLFQYLIYKSIASVAWVMIGVIGMAVVCVFFLEETDGKPLSRE